MSLHSLLDALFPAGHAVAVEGKLIAGTAQAGAGPVAVLRHAMRLPEQARAMLNGPQVLIEEV